MKIRGLAGAIALAAPLLLAPNLWAQETSPTQLPAFASVATLDRDRLFEETQQGKAIQTKFDADMAALVSENRKLEKALEEEERQLTDKRAELPADEFRKLAEAFDQKVEELRKAQDTKSRTLTAQIETDRQEFFQKVVPTIGNLMAEVGVSAILDRSAVILIFDKYDLTDLAIARIDANFPVQSTTPAPAANE